MQLVGLMMSPQPAYGKETVEFLASLQVNFYEPDEITWRTTDVFHFDHKEGRETELDTSAAELQVFWMMIGIGEYKSSTAKSTHIRNSTLRYVHKALTHTIYARRDVTNINEKELFLMNNGVVKFLHTLQTEQRWLKIGPTTAWRPTCSRVSSATESMPFLWTRSEKEEVGSSYLCKTTYLRGQPINGRHNYQFAYGPFDYELASFFLPNKELTYLTVRENVDFEPPIEAIQEQGQEEADHVNPRAAERDGEISGDDELPDEYKTRGSTSGITNLRKKVCLRRPKRMHWLSMENV
ncbi:unnamed protein product [Microthlaspi erraticum]|uniref:Arabidopsis retrotransposon Orf1 C-terminal domain-containing protein n=1 Tax=Microthlaspi erraticum TaxID=1685480 RepID=A0A6D2HS15_9BRAS|nr:unnamed protein product [Microthlaspi erraticum]CAA7019708.1 unnamed protein product [Microthlaspi erraticum]